MAKNGRPTKLTKKLGLEICQLIAEKHTLRQIEARENMPAKGTILSWNFKEGEIYEWFQNQYARAMKIRAYGWAEEIVDISDDGSNDYYEREGKDGKSHTTFDHEHVQRSRLRIDSRKFLMAKALPKIFGDKSEEKEPPKPEQDRPIVFKRGETRKSQQTIEDVKKNGTE